MIHAGEHSIIFGMTGSGKSTLTRKISTLFLRKIIFDRLREWSGEGIEVDSYDSFKKVFRELHLSDSFCIVFQPGYGGDSDSLVEETNQILALIFQVESHTQKGIALIFEELWLYAPLHNIPAWFQETMLTGRHHNISVIGNSQRPADVSKTFVSQARHCFVGQFYEYRDRKYFEDTFGRIPELANPPKKFTFYWFRPAEKPLLISTM